MPDRIPTSGAHPDPLLWQDWIDTHLGSLLLFARQQTRTNSDAEDVLQDALIESWRRSGGACPDMPLVYTTIRRRAIDLGRRIKVRADFAESVSGEDPWHEPVVESRDEGRCLREAVELLPINMHDVVTLKTWGGLTFAEIADVLEISANTAASRYRLAMARLRSELSHMSR